MSLESRIKTSISIPDYFKKFIDNKIDLIETPKIPCPFHQSSRDSFTYSEDKNLCRCWSRCGGGGVIWLHQMNYSIKNKEVAMESLAELLGIKKVELDLSNKPIKVDELLVKLISYTAKADGACKCVEDYLKLDLIMSQRKPTHETVKDLEIFLTTRGVVT